MFDFSVFSHEVKMHRTPCEILYSKDFKVFVDGKEVPVYTCRISSYPFNRVWPGHQREINQTEIVSYVNLISDEEIEVEVQPLTKTAYERILLKPYAKNVSFEKKGDRIVFRLKQNGGYVLELDDYHGLLYIFNNKPCPCEDPENVTYYFGKGLHFPGKIELKSGESVYLEKDALVYGCIFAENAENIRIYGNGILDDSMEERVSEHCYEPYANGNMKFYDCKNITVQGVGMTNSAIWCINLFHCFDVHIDGANVFGQWRYNTDGIDIVNSQRVTVQNSFVHSFDDTISIKGIDPFSFDINADILVENCVLWCDWGRTMEIGLETKCLEYRNITFRKCDILRAGSFACDIQNGDCALVHDIVFEDFSVELERAYTKMQIQQNDEHSYEKGDVLEIASLLGVFNPRYRSVDTTPRLEGDVISRFGKAGYAGVRNITVKNAHVYCDENILSKYGSSCVKICIRNLMPGSEYHDINVKDVFLNGKKLSREDMSIEITNCDENTLTVT